MILLPWQYKNLTFFIVCVRTWWTEEYIVMLKTFTCIMYLIYMYMYITFYCPTLLTRIFLYLNKQEITGNNMLMRTVHPSASTVYMYINQLCNYIAKGEYLWTKSIILPVNKRHLSMRIFELHSFFNDSSYMVCSALLVYHINPLFFLTYNFKF